MTKRKIIAFQKVIWNYYKKNKRSFPWRETKNPYHVLVSEIMLQQTQADRVVEYYKKWLLRFPDPKSLAEATFSEIYPYWQGLGYNRRALALQKSAQKAIQDYQGKFPENVSLLEEFPGIGPYTARAISIFSWNMPISCIETNIRRVFIHHFFKDREGIEDREILELASQVLPKGKSREWHWALMDYGTYLKGTVKNPNRRHKNYRLQSKFEGSLRQIRGAILKNLAKEKMALNKVLQLTPQTQERTKLVLEGLMKEGFIVYNKQKKRFSLK